MVLSMTGFGRGVAEYAGKRFTVEVKSLNSKQFDLSMRWPNAYKEKELEVRTMLASALLRGKVDFTMNVEVVAGQATQKVNAEVLAAYKEQISEAAKKIGVSEPADWMMVLMRMPEVLTNEDREMDESEWEAILSAINSAINAIQEYRKIEGESLKRVFEKNVGAISTLLGEVDPYEKERVEQIKQKLRDNLANAGIDYDKNRFEQELIYYIEKLDVNEEKNRLAQHIKFFNETMNGAEESIGKRLGFIAQEMGREINTLGSKSNQAEMQRIVVRMKDELEQIKEQVLNVL